VVDNGPIPNYPRSFDDDRIRRRGRRRREEEEEGKDNILVYDSGVETDIL
jgi:hypothetical protein